MIVNQSLLVKLKAMLKPLNHPAFFSKGTKYAKIVSMTVQTQDIHKTKRLSNPFRMAKGHDPVIHVTLMLLAFFGVVMIGSATMGETVGAPKTLMLTIAKQLIFVMMGYFLMAFASRNFRLSQLHGNGFSVCIITLYILLLSTRAFTGANGSYAWIRIPGVGITIQPSEFAKIATFLVVAGHLGDRRTRNEKFWELVKRPVIICFIMSFIILMIQKDFGTMSVQFMIFCICFLIPRNPKLKKAQNILRGLFYGLIALAVFILSPQGEHLVEALPFKTYQKNRFLSAINPFADVYGSGYQLIQSLVAMSGGGLFGRGLGRSVRKYMNFPEANNDYILGIIVEELGFAGFVILMAIYAIIIYRLLWYAKQMKSEAGRIVLVGTAMYFMLHIFLNVGGVSGLIPLTGIPLPLVSAGGSSAMSFMLSIGLSQSVIASYRRGDLQ